MAVLSHEIIDTSGIFIANEVPTGDINSSNKLFTLANDPKPESVQLYLNGSAQTPGSTEDYTLLGKNITFNKAPRTGSKLLVHYFLLS